MNADDMTMISLFDGIGGFPLAFSRVGVRTTAAVEIDKHAAGVVADRFPDIKHFDDIMKVTGVELLATGFDPRRGIVSAGFPCQDLSLAGRRMGLDGARSGLYFEIIRILDELRTASGVLCRWVVLENVPGLLSAVCPCPGSGACGSRCTDPHTVRGGACGPGRCIEIHGGAMGAVLGELAQLGYGFAYRVLDAQHFGVPQRRRRVVIVAHSGNGAAPAQVLLEPESGRRNSAAGRAARARTARVLADSIAIAGEPGVDLNGGREVVNSLKLSGLGGNGGPDDDTARGGHLVASLIGAVPTVQSHHGRNSPGQDVLIPVDALAYQGHGTNVGPMGTLRAGSGTVTGGVPFTLGGEVAHALTAEGADASEDGTGRGTPIVAVGFAEVGSAGSAARDSSPTVRTGTAGAATMAQTPAAVRRLTPVECERLQGYPDEWTATSYGKASADSQRYRRLGNSIAVPVFHWVALGIAEAESTREGN